MEKENLNIALQKFKLDCKKDLIDSLRIAGHVESGDLIESIDVKIEIKNEDYNIRIIALQYIQYLDDGRFLSIFLKKKSEELKKIIPKAIKKDIIKEIKNNL